MCVKNYVTYRYKQTMVHCTGSNETITKNRLYTVFINDLYANIDVFRFLTLEPLGV